MSLRRTLRFLALGAIAGASILAAGGRAHAQGDNQRCEGTVVNDQGNPLANVKINFLQSSTNRAAQSVSTSKKGKYAHNTLVADSSTGYEVRAVLAGYKILKISALTTKGDGTKVTNEQDGYLVGSDQKG